MIRRRRTKASMVRKLSTERENTSFIEPSQRRKSIKKNPGPRGARKIRFDENWNRSGELVCTSSGIDSYAPNDAIRWEDGFLLYIRDPAEPYQVVFYLLSSGIPQKMTNILWKPRHNQFFPDALVEALLATSIVINYTARRDCTSKFSPSFPSNKYSPERYTCTKCLC